MAKPLREMEGFIENLSQEIKNDLLDIIEVKGQSFIKKNFEEEGFNNKSIDKWHDRKTTDTKGRDNTRYRTNRVGRKGNLNKYGQSLQDRPILTGHATGGDKLRNSFRARKEGNKVVFFTYKIYAKRHNEGLNGMLQRQFMGPSASLDRNIKYNITRYLNKKFK